MARHGWLATVLVIALSAAGCQTTQKPMPTPSVTSATSAPTAAAPRRTASAASPWTSALVVARSLPVKGRAPMTGYSRARFGQAWTDDNDEQWGHNGCDTRNDILRRDLTHISMRGDSSCVVATGVLRDRYTGRTIDFVRGVGTSTRVQIDHRVPLGLAWQTGAQQWSARKRVDFANDPRNLVAVYGPVNQSKGDADVASWLPPNKAYRCAYVADIVAVTKAYGLWALPAEKQVAISILTRCAS